MPLAVGTRLGPYEVLAPLGAGGMGEVYRARDPKLRRDVALKVLPAAFSADPERRARFTREAQALAALNHPHIAAIYGVEEADGVTALVLELVEGPTLDARIAGRPVPVPEALAIAAQIADALEAAHEKGIVHRDLKPANIKLTGSGQVKVLDFGLAKALVAESSPDAAQSPTMTAMASRLGVIMGTAAYMSPEQAKGKAVDKRTDIWAFGCVLFEMLTGRRAFDGEDVTDSLVAVMTKEPGWTFLPPATPSRIVELLKRCLKKDPRERLHDIADARLEIEEVVKRGPRDAGPEASAPGHATPLAATRREKVAWTLLTASLAALGVASVMLSGTWPRARVPESRQLRVSILHSEGRDVGVPAISPDGRRVAYGARRADGMPMLWVRDLSSGEARALPGTEDAGLPFWSPDSRDLGFFAGPSLKRVPADGGPVQVIAGNVNGRGGTWAPDGTVVLGSNDYELLRVSAVPGSVAAPLTKLQGEDWSHLWPSFLPDGRRFLFTAKQWTRTAEASVQGIYLGSLDSPEIRRLLPDLSSAVYAPPGYLVFVRDRTLTAVPFDLATGRVTGPPASLGPTVAIDDVSYLAAVSAAADGTVAMRPPPAMNVAGSNLVSSVNADLRLVDRSGAGSPVGTAELFAYTMALHPDGRRLAASIVDPRTSTDDLWLIDLLTGVRNPVTATHGYTGSPVWSPDGTRLAYAYQPPGQLDDVYIKDLGTGQITPVIQSPALLEHPVAWSRDGASLLVYTSNGSEDTLAWWAFGSRTLTRFAGSGTAWAAFSPDDRFVAFSSSESGRAEVAVTTFPERRQTWALTTEGGRVLSWRADGREILVATLSGQIVAYPVSTTGGFSAGQPTVLVRDLGFAASYSAATRDHSRILIRVSPDAAKDKGEIRLLFGWQDALRLGRR